MNHRTPCAMDGGSRVIASRLTFEVGNTSLVQPKPQICRLGVDFLKAFEVGYSCKVPCCSQLICKNLEREEKEKNTLCH